MKRFAIVLAVVVPFACAEGDSRTTFDLGDGGSDASPDGTFQEAATPCEDAATHVYVLSDKSELYRFRPWQLLFEKVGAVGCDTLIPNSMAVDRFGTAWVNYKSGDLYRVSTRNAALQPQYSDNFDATVEYYFEPVGTVSASVFLKEVSDFQFTDSSQLVPAGQDNGFGGLYEGIAA